MVSANTTNITYDEKNNQINSSGRGESNEDGGIFPPRRNSVYSEFNPENYWAFLVTVDYKDDKPWGHYKHIKKTLLDNHWLDSHIKTVIQEDATRENVKREFDNWLVRKTSEEDTILIIFDAHGYENVEAFGKEIVPGGLCLYGYKDGNGALDDNALQYDVLDRWLGDLSNRKIMILIDACHSGNAIKHIKGNDRCIITACEEGGYSYGISDEFSDALTIADSPFLGNNAPNLGDGFVSAKEIYEYLDHYSSRNNPQIWPSFSTNFDIDIVYIKPTVEITRPKGNYLYFNDKEIMPFFSTIVFFGLTIEAAASDSNVGIKDVVFYIDDKEVYRDIEAPYYFYWNGEKGNHQIKVVTHTKNNFFAYSYSDEKSITISYY